MAILNVFSKRDKPPLDVYTYDQLPQKLRVQIVHILRGDMGYTQRNKQWATLANAIACEHGLLALPTKQVRRSQWDQKPHDYFADCVKYVLEADAENALDMVERAIRWLDRHLRKQDGHRSYRSPDDAIQELNHRFRENGCGYQYVSGNIVRVDSHVLHADVAKPALALLSKPGFEGPNKEYMAAHEHFRHGRVEETCTDACKAFESTMKTICDARGWAYDPRAAAQALIKVLIDKGLVPAYSEGGLMHVATIRNKNSGHGAGSKPRDVPEHYAAYALHLAGSNIVFLVKCHEAMK